MDEENKEVVENEDAPKVLYGFAVSIIEGQHEPNIEVFGKTSVTELAGLANHASVRFTTMCNDEAASMLYALKNSIEAISERQSISAEASQTIIALLGRVMAPESPPNTNCSNSSRTTDISPEE